MSALVPMVYSKQFENAAQWQGLSDFSQYNLGETLRIYGSMTEWGSCDQHGTTETDPLCSTASNGYIKLYSALNTFPETAVPTSILKWSTDIKWWPSIYQ